MPALSKRHRRERAKARSGLVGLHTVRPGHRGRDPPARDRTVAPAAMPGVPDRHRVAASRRPDLRRQPAKTFSRGCCAAGAARYPDPRRTSMAQSTAHKHDSTRRATYQDVLDAPAHLVAEVVDGTLHTHPRRMGSGTIGESCRRSPHDEACAGTARAHRGPPATMPALPKRHRQERAKARPSLVGLHTVRPSQRGRDPPARDCTAHVLWHHLNGQVMEEVNFANLG